MQCWVGTENLPASPLLELSRCGSTSFASAVQVVGVVREEFWKFSFSYLHGAHNQRLQEKASIVIHLFVGFFLILFSLHLGGLCNLELQVFVGIPSVERINALRSIFEGLIGPSG